MTSDDKKVEDAKHRLNAPPNCPDCSSPMDTSTLKLSGVQMHWCCEKCGILFSVEKKSNRYAVDSANGVYQVGFQCSDCTKLAMWVRSTQFAGDHYFCDAHGRAQSDFGKSDPSYYLWARL